jgi:hypothetical protein
MTLLKTGSLLARNFCSNHTLQGHQHFESEWRKNSFEILATVNLAVTTLCDATMSAVGHTRS